MKPLLRAIRNERGVALPLALFALVMLSGLLLAFLTMSGMEPRIAANLNDVTRARYAAEAGLQETMNWFINSSASPTQYSPPSGTQFSSYDMTKYPVQDSTRKLSGICCSAGRIFVCHSSRCGSGYSV